MLLRRISQHVHNQNWFAVALDFFIVVLGILIAFQITNWSDDRKARADLALAESALTGDLVRNYIWAQERITLNTCRIESLRAMAERLMAPGDLWEGMPRGELDIDVGFAIDPVLRSPKREWGSSTWAAELARGTFNNMAQERREQLDVIFKMAAAAEDLQNAIMAGQGRLKVLGQSMELSRSDRLRYYDIVAEIDENSHFLEYTSGLIAEAIKALDIKLGADSRKYFAPEPLAAFNLGREAAYGPCIKLIEIPFYNETNAGLEDSQPIEADQP